MFKYVASQKCAEKMYHSYVSIAESSIKAIAGPIAVPKCRPVENV